jgi:hypothetical protein
VAAVASPPASQRRARREALVLVAALAACALWTGLGIGYEATGRVLGTALPPFVAGWGPRADALWLSLAVAACAVAVAGADRLVLRARPSAFAAGTFAIGLALVLTVNAARSGPEAWTATFDVANREGRNEYLAALGALTYGPGFLLDRFAELVPTLPPHPAAHPPGLLVTVDLLGLGTKERLAALCLASVAVLGPLTWRLGRAVGLDEPRARLAGLATAVSPVLLLFGGTSADALFAVLGTVAALLLAPPARPGGAVRGPEAVRLAAGAVALAVAALFAWSLLAIGAWAAVLTLVRCGWRRALVLCVACAAGLVAVNGVLAAGWGYDPVGTLRATEEVYRDSLAQVRPYWFWWLGSPVAWTVLLGLPLAAGAIVALLRRHPAAVAIGAVIAVAALAGFTKAETERIWLPFVPLAAVAAATVLPPLRARAVVAALVAQALLVSVLFGTLW